MKKVAITQDICRMVELMLKGGAKPQEIGERLGISKTTVSRIKTAGFDAEQYRKNTTERVEKENQAETIHIPLEPGKVLRVDEKHDGITVHVETEQVPGQISMDLQPAEGEKPEMGDQVKLMRFLAGKTEELKDNAKTCAANIGLTLAKIDARLDAILRILDG